MSKSNNYAKASKGPYPLWHGLIAVLQLPKGILLLWAQGWWSRIAHLVFGTPRSSTRALRDPSYMRAGQLRSS